MKPKKVIIRKRGFPTVDMTKHKTGAALIHHVAAFNKARHFVPGGIYIIDGKEVRI